MLLSGWFVRDSESQSALGFARVGFSSSRLKGVQGLGLGFRVVRV